MPRIRTRVEDFQVEELPLYEPSGEGDHTFVLVEKVNLTTLDVVQRLARLARVQSSAVGFAGRKDRRAVTRQWFSVPFLDPDVARSFDGAGLEVLDAARHRHKLRTGQLIGNRFKVRVREVTEAEGEGALAKVAVMSVEGMVNRYGAQRFGREGDNAARGADILRGDRLPGARRHHRFLVSALQSAVFNRVLERRPVGPGEILSGDVAVVHRSGGLFLVKDAAVEGARAATFEISPTGPIFGSKMKMADGEVRVLEESVMREWDLGSLSLMTTPRGLRVHGGRRSLRVLPWDVRGAFLKSDLDLEFSLPAGSYATVLLEELFGGTEIEEGSAG